MYNLKGNKKSITSFFTLFTIITILIQTFLLTFLFMGGGVFKQAKKNAYKSFNDTVVGRRNHLQELMKNRWTNFNPFISNFRNNALNSNLASDEDLLKSSLDDLIRMLRFTEVTGAYIVLNSSESTPNQYNAIYLRNYDTAFHSTSYGDIYMVSGFPKFAREYKFPLDSKWQYNISLNKNNKDFFVKPYENSKPGIDPSFLGYWSQPFQLIKDDIPIITYSMPFQNLGEEAIGVIGVEISESHFSKFLPASDLQSVNSLGYIIAKRDMENDKLHMILSTNNVQKRFIDGQNPLEFKAIDDEYNIYLFLNPKTKENIYASMAKLDIYPHASPYQNEEWYIIGFMHSEFLLGYVNKISRILKISVVISLLLGSSLAIFWSNRMSQPVISLVDQIKKADKTKELSLNPTGLLELDELSTAMIETNKLVLNSASHLTRVIEMVDLPIAAFEINKSSKNVLITGKIFDILKYDDLGYKGEISKHSFLNFLNKILSHPEPEEENIYKLPLKTNKWVKIKINNSGNQISGIVQDVTEEILEKRDIRQDRDLDPLTRLLNRKSFQFHYEQWHKSPNKGVAALIMFDIDSLKYINDSYGHKWGDEYIIRTTEALKNLADPKQYILGRRSGDEFVMLLFNYKNKDEIRNLLIDFYSNLVDYQIAFPDGKISPVMISSGFVWIENSKFSYDHLLHYADQALYHSKFHNKGYFTEGGY